MELAILFVCVDLSNKPPSRVKVRRPNGELSIVEVHYLLNPVRCEYCGNVGHDTGNCRFRIAAEEKARLLKSRKESTGARKADKLIKGRNKEAEGAAGVERISVAGNVGQKVASSKTILSRDKERGGGGIKDSAKGSRFTVLSSVTEEFEEAMNDVVERVGE